MERREQVTLTFNGQKIFGILHLPVDTTFPVPAVLLCHGFGGNKSGKYRLFVRLAEALSTVGIASFRFDFRGAGDSEGAFQDTTIESLCEDASFAFEYLQSHPAIDDSRISILGRSLGGLIAVLIAARFGCVQSLILWAAVFDAKPWIERQAASQSAPQPLFEHLGTKVNKNFITQFMHVCTQTVLEALEEVPLLYVQAEQDQSVGKYHVEQYEHARAKATALTRIFRVPHSDHEFSHADEQQDIIHASVEWMLNR